MNKEVSYEKFFDLSRDILVIVGDNDYFLKVNRRFVEILGYTEEEILTNPISYFVHPEDMEKTNNRIKRVMNGEAELKLINRYRRKDGIYRYIQWTSMLDEASNNRYAVGRDITDEIDIKVLMEESQKTAKIGGWELDVKTRKIFWTKEVYKIYGITEAEQPNIKIGVAQYHPSDRAILLSAVNAAMKGTPYDLKLRFIRQGEQEIWVRTKGFPIFDKSGEVIKLRGTLQNIDEEERTRIQLRENQQMLEMLIKHTPTAVAMLDNEMRYLAYSDRWLTDYSIKDTNILGKTHYEVFPDIPKRWKADHQRVLNGEIFRQEEDKWQREDGSDFYVKYELRPWRNGNGEIGGLIMFTEVITEQVQTRLALEKRREELQAIFDSFPDLFFRLSRDGTYLDYKSGIQEPLLSPEAFLGKRITDIMSPEAAKIQMYLLEECISEQKITYSEYSMRYPDGEKHFESRYLPLKNQEALVVVREITPLVQNRQKLKETVDELTNSKIDLEQFAYITSHDLQEPLRMVGSFSQLLERRYYDKLDDTGKQYLTFIFAAALRMKNLISNLQQYTKVGLKEEEIGGANVKKMIQQKLRDLQPIIQEKKVNIVLNELPKSIKCYVRQLELVFYNLIHNAIKFNDATNPEIKIGYSDKETIYEFYIRDNGIGIAEKYSEKVFMIFQRLHERDTYGGGMGIGLALSKKIIKRHQGEIWYKPNKNGGTTFYFTIKK